MSKEEASVASRFRGGFMFEIIILALVGIGLPVTLCISCIAAGIGFLDDGRGIAPQIKW